MRYIQSLFTAICMAIALGAMAQTGQPFVTDIPFERSLGEVRVNQIVQSADRSMLLCTPRGILAFDGALWEMIPTPSQPLTIANTPDGRIFIGMKKGAAELSFSDSGTYKISPLLPNNISEAIEQILVSKDNLFLFSDSRLVSVNLISGAKGEEFEYTDKVFQGAFNLFELPHLFFYQEGLFSFQNKKLSKIGTYIDIADNQLLFDLSSKRGTYLGFDNGDVHVFNGMKMNRLGGQLGQYLKANRLSGGIILNDSLIAFATLSGGTVVADRRTHSISYTLNYTTGLPDNEISALGRDDNGGLWMAYGSGVSRLDLLQPISRYHNYPGLRGIITSTAVFEDKLYVATGNGVFVLQETTDRAEVKRLLEQKAEESSQEQPEPRSVEPKRETVSPLKQQQSEKDALVARYIANPEEAKKDLSRKELRELKKEVKRKKKANETQTASQNEEPMIAEPEPVAPEPIVAPPAAIEPQQSKSTTKTANSKRPSARSDTGGQGTFVFRPVSNINVKCRQLAVINNMLFAATSNGLYRISGNSGINLTPNVYVNHVSASRNNQKLLLATTKGVMTLETQGAPGSATIAAPTSDFNVYNAIEDAKGNLWAGADNEVICYTKNAKGYNAKTYPLDNQQLEKVLVAEIGGQIHFLLGSGILKFNGSSPEKANIKSIPTNERLSFVLGNKGNVWVNSASGWQVLNEKGLEKLLPYLPVFEDIRHLATDGNGNLFVVEKGAQVYSISSPLNLAKSDTFSVFIRMAMTEDRTPFGMGELTVQHSENSLIFQLSAPFYLKSEATEFQYRVEGLRDNWSRWSNATTIEIPFVPAGNYVLEVRAKNVLGEISETRSLPFTVLKPIMLRWYALLFYGLVFIGIVIAIIKAREKSLKETQRELEDKVQERTADLALEKERTEKLLLNILPKETADELQKRGKATARHYNQVSVLFTDFKGFTRFAESTRPEDLVNELDYCFIAFDDVIEKYHLEKIKTIGDAYMCAGGVPIRNTNNAVAIVLAALEIRDFMMHLQSEKKQRNERFWEIRIGVNTGPLTAGVVGKKKFAYDIWGDTVNTASRMESTSDPGQVNISATTFELVKDYFECTYRGKIDAKGKGEVDMYFVNGIRPEYSLNGDGKTPNEQLFALAS